MCTWQATGQRFGVKIDDRSRRELQAATPASVTLVAVSKTFEADAIRPVIEAGQRVFGENRVQEAQGKWPALKRGIPGSRTASDRPAAVQQGEGGRRAVRRHRDRRPREDRRRTGQGDRAAGQARRGSTSRSTPGSEPQKAGIDPREAVAFVDALPRGARARHRRPDGDPARGRKSRPAFRPARKAGARGRRRKALHGHVRRLRDRNRVRRDQRARRLGDLRERASA